jgi:8-oxo-dGTP diphosphatase
MRFNVRVYGLLIHQNAILVSDEFIKGNFITKFPGGGLEFGEGTRECLAREFKEELDLLVTVEAHFYTTDFYVTSSFDTNSQVLSIYYFVSAAKDFKIAVSESPHNYQKKEGAQAFRWIKMKKLRELDVSLIIDKKVVEMLIKQFGHAVD